MKLYVLYSKPSCITGRALRTALNCEGGMNPPSNKVDFILNYGSTTNCGDKAQKGIINSPEIVALNTNKKNSLFSLEKAGVSTPKIFTPQSAQKNLDQLPMVGRKSSHKSGSGFYLCLNKRDLVNAINAGCTYFMKYVPVDVEYRVHVFNGSPIRIQEKVAAGKTAHPHIRTHSHGWNFLLRNQKRDNIPASVKQEAIKAVLASGLVFGAVDIGVDHNGKAFVFEVNTGASLDQEGSGIDTFIKEVNKFIEKNK